MYDLLIIGGGAAGFFTAINTAEKHPNFNIAILEKSKEVLHKVRISGGGRCNLTNATFTPQELVKNYPRGSKELLSPFHRFMCGDTMEWFEAHSVSLKTEPDGRVFPISNTSESIVNCFLNEIKKHHIELFAEQNVQAFSPTPKGWQVSTPKQTYIARNVVITTGSNPKIWQLLANLGHTIIPPVPSLFTFHTSTQWTKELSGIAVNASVSLLSKEGKSLKITETAPLLFTHTGFSGPAVLRTSAWGARVLAECNYQCFMEVNFTANVTEALSYDETLSVLQEFKQHNGRKAMQSFSLFEFPKRLWSALLENAGIALEQVWAELNKPQLRRLAEALTQYRFPIEGKATFKEEFVTAGGIKLSEINFKTYESKLYPQLYLAGEVLDIDAITGGFNFQNAWTGGYIIAESIQ
ncbi:NAD(P)/FAD-dependent oxidoreductase [Capnocytophaga ochracea]|jgi:flavoprotein family protein|uniref:NAD(P)/FAD-dependent oxidoreductase n=1 Tax=Capnocytophaga ochracea TaxID=1018 RepID=UPI0006614746|nr:NAD(P)/FAD-dependent oxidoreductase [Capnocytophaga ochracea]